MKKHIGFLLLASALPFAQPVFAESAKKLENHLMKADVNKDGMISRDEFNKEKEEMFGKLDKDSNGMLDANEQKMAMDHWQMKTGENAAAMPNDAVHGGTMNN